MTARIILFSISLFIIASCGEKSTRKTVFTEKAPKPIGPYSQAVKSGNLLFVSGQIGIDSFGKMDTTSLENECRQVLINIRSVVEASGAKTEDVCKTTIYLTDLKNFKTVNEVYGNFFSNNPPARETVEVKGLPKGARVEISVIAVVPE